VADWHSFNHRALPDPITSYAGLVLGLRGLWAIFASI